MIKDATAVEKLSDFGAEIITTILLEVDSDSKACYASLMPLMVQKVDAMWDVKRGGTKKKPVYLSAEFVRDVFKTLPLEEREAFAVAAKERGDKEKLAYKALLSEPPSKDPADRAKYVVSLQCVPSKLTYNKTCSTLKNVQGFIGKMN